MTEALYYLDDDGTVRRVHTTPPTGTPVATLAELFPSTIYFASETQA